MAYEVAPDIAIGALICCDAKVETKNGQTGSENNEALHKSLKESLNHATRKIVCVPACWRNYSDIEDSCNWNGYDWIVANSDGSRPQSFIRLNGKLECRTETKANTIEISRYDAAEVGNVSSTDSATPRP